MQIFETKFENRRKETVRVWEQGRVMLTIKPGEVRHVESTSPFTTYAPWKAITFSGEDKIHFSDNPDFTFPWPGKLRLEAVNLDGAEVERMNFGTSQYYDLYKGIPRFIPIDYDNINWYWIEKVEKKFRVESSRQGDHIVKLRILHLEKTLRSRKEVKAIEARLVAEAQERAKKETERSFPRLDEEGKGDGR